MKNYDDQKEKVVIKSYIYFKLRIKKIKMFINKEKSTRKRFN